MSADIESRLTKVVEFSLVLVNKDDKNTSGMLVMSAFASAAIAYV
jgi:hypothetical protein